MWIKFSKEILVFFFFTTFPAFLWFQNNTQLYILNSHHLFLFEIETRNVSTQITKHDMIHRLNCINILCAYEQFSLNFCQRDVESTCASCKYRWNNKLQPNYTHKIKLNKSQLMLWPCTSSNGVHHMRIWTCNTLSSFKYNYTYPNGEIDVFVILYANLLTISYMWVIFKIN